MASYQVVSVGVVWMPPSGPVIKLVPEDPHYATYAAWVLAGGVPDPPSSALSPADTIFADNPFQTLQE